MLQFIARNNDRYSLGEQAQMAIEGGCKWVRIDSEESAEALRETMGDIIAICRETGTILTFDGRAELAKELGVHGVVIAPEGDPATVRKAVMRQREDFGPEAIIGVEVHKAADAVALTGTDTDFCVLPEGTELPVMATMIADIRKGGCELPVVAQGEYSPADVAAVMATGASGIAVSSAIALAHDPVAATEEFLKVLGV